MPTRDRKAPGPEVRRLEEMTRADVEALDRRRTLVAIPVSPIEEHGPHLPLGTDGYLSLGLTDGLLERLAARRPDWTLVRTPWLPIGCYTLEGAGSVEIDQAAVRAVVAGYGHALARHGVPLIVVLNGHGGPGQGAALEEACREVSRRHSARMIYPVAPLLSDIFAGRYWDRIGDQLGRPLSSEERRALQHDFHAGALETSYLQLRYPDLVQGDVRSLPDVETSKVGMMRWYWGDRVGQGPGYMGYPSRADPRLAEAIEAVLCDEVAALVERAMDGEDVQPAITGEFYRNPLFRTRARPVARAFERSGRAVLGTAATLRGRRRG